MALPKPPPIETSNVSEARRQFSETLDRVRRHEARVVVEKSGIPVGAIVSMEDLASLRQIEDEREVSRQKLKQMTGDKGMLAIGEYRGVSVLAAREFLMVMDRLEP